MSWIQVVVLIYAITNIAGGVFAYSFRNSMPSLIVGVGSGVLLLLLLAATKKWPGMAYRIIGVAVLALAGFWIFRTVNVSQDGGSIMMPLMNLVLAIAVFAALMAAHFLANRKRAA